ncbi:unnamed protein product [Effrenium voratum]|uniref:Uncharacterized protein n=1 Tax=Effrenium voratum TaxID=2562239 RepID=A0AA36MJQ2_9DINO|nr:unnamed protein product [Effrenium voratum]
MALPRNMFAASPHFQHPDQMRQMRHFQKNCFGASAEMAKTAGGRQRTRGAEAEGLRKVQDHTPIENGKDHAIPQEVARVSVYEQVKRKDWGQSFY